MRISTAQIYTSANRNMLEGQSKLAEIQDKISSGKEFTSLADNPVGANQVVTLKRELAQLDMFQTNIDSTRRRLALEDTTLREYTNTLDRARVLMVQGANGTLTDNDRKSISYELEEITEYMVGLMNTRDAKGEYLFAGSQGTEPAYTSENGRFSFRGDSVERTIQVASGVYLDSTDSGLNIFESVTESPAVTSTGPLAASIVDTDVNNPASYAALVRTAGDIRLRVDQVNPDPLIPSDNGLRYSLLDSSDEPLTDTEGRVLLGVPYLESEAKPSELEVSLPGVTLTLALPLSAELGVERVNEPLQLKLSGIDTSVLDNVVVQDDSLLSTFMDVNGNLQLQTEFNDVAGVYSWALQNSQGVTLESGSYQPTSVGSLSTGVNLTFPLSLNPDELSFRLNVNGVPSGEITLNGDGDLATTDFANASELIDALQLKIDTDSLLSAAGITVGYTAAGGGSPVGINFTASDPDTTLRFAFPDDSASDQLGIQSNQVALSPAGMGATFNLDMPLNGVGIAETIYLATPDYTAITGSDKSILQGTEVRDTEQFTRFMLDNNNLQLNSSFDSTTGIYSWQLSNAFGDLLEEGSYREQSFGVLASSDLSLPLELPSPGQASFQISVNGVRSQTLVLAGDGTALDDFANESQLISALQAQLDSDPMLTEAGMTVSFVDGQLNFSVEDGSAQLGFAYPDAVAAETLGMMSNQRLLNVEAASATFNLELPTAQSEYSEKIYLNSPDYAVIRLEQIPSNPVNAILDAIDALRTPLEGDETVTEEFNAQMALVLDQLLEAQERVSEAAADIGARLNSLDSAELSNTDFRLMTEGTLSSVEDLDYAAAATELAKRQLALEASYASFAKIQGLSLFNYIN